MRTRRAFTLDEITELRKIADASGRPPWGAITALAKRMGRSSSSIHVKLNELRKRPPTFAETAGRLLRTDPGGH